MKKLILLVIFSITISTYLNSQNAFPTSNAMWNESIRGVYSIYGLYGDTIFNDISYSKIYKLSDTILLRENLQEYIGGIRSEGEKVWFRPVFWTDPDILLYDFGAEVGDTVKHNADIRYNNYNGEYYMIEPNTENAYSVIDEITIFNNRKRYEITCPQATYVSFSWYEGIGSSKGLFLSILRGLPMSMSQSDFKLNCFKHNDTVKYLSNYPYSSCFCPNQGGQTDILSYDLDTDFFKIYPNPATDIINIEIIEDIKLKSLAVYSIDGKLIEKNRYSYNTGKLNISNLKKGSYILKLEADNIIYKKLIIKE